MLLCNDIRTCLEPASVSPHEWPDDITKWPVSMTQVTRPVDFSMLLFSIGIDLYLYRLYPG